MTEPDRIIRIGSKKINYRLPVFESVVVLITIVLLIYIAQFVWEVYRFNKPKPPVATIATPITSPVSQVPENSTGFITYTCTSYVDKLGNESPCVPMASVEKDKKTKSNP